MDLAYKEKAVRKLWRSLSESVVVVEGRNDEKALKEIGIDAVAVKAVGRTEKIIEKAVSLSGGGKKKIVLLFDYDAEGRRKAKYFRDAFFNAGFMASVGEWNKLSQLFKIRTIEDLPRAYDELMDEIAAGKRRTTERA